ncbi:hypothetical protein B0H14DRAFT_2568242 [Mycena olivaceomarginata]|nr:hypothetical protein B0H14DRAFT_2568242 [Mycena olivaceomarginata]
MVSVGKYHLFLNTPRRLLNSPINFMSEPVHCQPMSPVMLQLGNGPISDPSTSAAGPSGSAEVAGSKGVKSAGIMACKDFIKIVARHRRTFVVEAEPLMAVRIVFHTQVAVAGCGSGAGSGSGVRSKADHAVGEQFEASLASGVMASNRNELGHQTARNAKRHTSAIKKAKNTSAGNSKQRAQGRACHIHGGGEGELIFPSKAATSRPKQSKTTTTDEMELDGVEMVSLEVQIEPGIQPDALEPENDVDSETASPSEPSLDIDGEGDRGTSKTHEDAPVRKSKKTEAAVAPEPSSSGKRRTTRKPKAWSTRHTDDRIYTSFEFLAQFPDEYRALYGDTEPA